MGNLNPIGALAAGLTVLPVLLVLAVIWYWSPKVLVITSWRADTRPVDKEDNYVSIIGRESGLISWIASLLHIDATWRILVGGERIQFSEASLSGTQTYVIPLECVASIYFGYYKPWKKAAGIAALFVLMGWGLAASNGSVFTTITLTTAAGILVALVYYFFNRILRLGFTTHGGHTHAIAFKRSFIENKDINERQAASVSIIVERLIEAKRRRMDHPHRMAA